MITYLNVMKHVQKSFDLMNLDLSDYDQTPVFVRGGHIIPAHVYKEGSITTADLRDTRLYNLAVVLDRYL